MKIVYVSTVTKVNFEPNRDVKSRKNSQLVGTERQTKAKAAAKESFIPTMRELARTYQAFTSYSDAHIRSLGLTPPQFDVISTLGNTSGLSFNTLAEKTLITKGTLTGVIDRLEQKGLVQRQVPADDRRSFMAVLTSKGERVFEDVFPAHIAYLKQRFGKLNEQELEEIRVALKQLRDVF